MKIKVGLVDDHELFLRSVGLMLSSYDKFNVILEALNGVDLQEKISKTKNLPDVMLIDVNMPKMNGFETASWLKKNYPTIKLVALSMNDNDKTIIEMLKAGCCAYLLKDTHPDDLDKALVEVYEKGYYNGDATNINFRRLLMSEKDNEDLEITEHQKAFIQLCCTDFTYRQIAAELKISENTVDGYREKLFKKFNVQSRVGLVLEGIRRNLIQI
jgi:DNA-binding NarL/FixJ family response regulator